MNYELKHCTVNTILAHKIVLDSLFAVISTLHANMLKGPQSENKSQMN